MPGPRLHLGPLVLTAAVPDHMKLKTGLLSSLPCCRLGCLLWPGDKRGGEGKASHETPALGTECPSQAATAAVDWPGESSPCLAICCLKGRVLQFGTLLCVPRCGLGLQPS